MATTVSKMGSVLSKNLGSSGLSTRKFFNVNATDNKNLVLVLGITGVGKSTLINYLMGSRLVKFPLDPTDEYSPLAVKVSSDSKEYAHIGHEKKSDTLRYQIIGPSEEGVFYCDCPGFEDNREGEEKECASLNISLAIREAKNISSIIVVIDWYTIRDKTGKFVRLIKDLIKVLQELVILLSNAETEVPSPILFVITKTPSFTDSGELFKFGHVIAEIGRWKKYYNDILSKNLIELRSFFKIDGFGNDVEFQRLLEEATIKLTGNVATPSTKLDSSLIRALYIIATKLEEYSYKIEAEKSSKIRMFIEQVKTTQMGSFLVSMMLDSYKQQSLFLMKLDDDGLSSKAIIKKIIARKIHLSIGKAKQAEISASYVKAAKYYQMALVQGHREAQANLDHLFTTLDVMELVNIGIMYHDGKGVKQDHAQARKWYDKAIEKGAVCAIAFVGLLYEGGSGVEKDYVKAALHYQQALEKGYLNAQKYLDKLLANSDIIDPCTVCNIGVMYHNGEYNGSKIKQDYIQAKRWYEKAIAKGIAVACSNLGLLYEFGGVEKDQTTAAKYYQQGLEQGHKEAQINLDRLFTTLDATGLVKIGIMYHDGKGVKQDHAQAKKWYDKAIEKGAACAIAFVGLLYEGGLGGLEKDYYKAALHYQQALEKGYLDAQKYLDKLLTLLEINSMQYKALQKLRPKFS